MNSFFDNMKILLLLPLLLAPLPAFAETPPEYTGIENPSEYVLKVDEHVYDVPYQVNADVLSMEIDPETKSLLIALENTYDSMFVIDLDSEIINANNDEFAILVNGHEVNYEMIRDANSSTFSFFVPDFTEEVEVVGTHVIPEFPIGAIMGLTILITMVILFAKPNKLFRL